MARMLSEKKIWRFPEGARLIVKFYWRCPAQNSTFTTVITGFVEPVWVIFELFRVSQFKQAAATERNQ